MRRAFKYLGTGLLFLVVTLALTASLLPPLLDRHYYDGPVSDHYDGERFFNPGPGGDEQRSFALMARFFSGVGKAQWPEHVAVTPAYPPAAATACPPLRGAIVENWKRCVDRVDPRTMIATWIGHATVLVQAGGVNILTDPIFSERASPFSFAGPKRTRAPGIRLQDLPKIDLIVVSHNHYDHMDLPSLKALWKRDRPLILTSLGNDAIMYGGGVPSLALDWGQSQAVVPDCIELRSAEIVANYRQIESSIGCMDPGVMVTVERNHHWSSRWGADRNRALWSSFTIATPAGTIYHAGDTGIGDGRWFRDAAARGPIRLAILPIGAYEPRDAMKVNHVNPAEAVRIFDALKPAMALGVHWGTFQLTFEAIDAPPKELARVRGSRRFVVTEVGTSIVVPER